MGIILNLFGILFTVVTTVNSQFRFDYSFNAKVGGWLKLHILPENFYDAFRKCDAEGAVLASPINVFLKNAMESLQKSAKCENCPLLTGIHSTFAKGSFTSIEGKLMSRIPVEWAPGEPDNYDDTEECIVMLQNGTLADVRCSETFPFVCYKKKTVNMVLNECGTTDPEYSLDSRTGSCYKFHYIAQPWTNAYMTCIAEGGYLTIINSDTELQVIKDLYKRTPAEKIFSPGRTRTTLSIGFHDWGETGVWYTVHGQKLQNAGFPRFADGQPDNDRSFDSRGSHCGAIFIDIGQLDDIWCTGFQMPFICEKDPDSLLTDDEQY